MPACWQAYHGGNDSRSRPPWRPLILSPELARRTYLQLLRHPYPGNWNEGLPASTPRIAFSRVFVAHRLHIVVLDLANTSVKVRSSSSVARASVALGKNTAF
jgi:hypothetical protein